MPPLLARIRLVFGRGIVLEEAGTFSESLQIEVSKGDVLYVPAGVWVGALASETASGLRRLILILIFIFI